MVGKVILVGAGPGNAGLLTLRGKAALESADAVLYDRLAGPEILAMIPDGAAIIDVGKSAGRHPIPQSEINAMLLRFAKEGKTVVRLKGGDPYLFGRGAEELEAVQKENIPFEVVPGVTSALAAPAFAGIPASHREHSSSVHIVTAHRKENYGKPLENICRALLDLRNDNSDVLIVWPVHLSPSVRETVMPLLGEQERILLTNPAELLDLHNLMSRSALVLTDSGGLQEEAPALGKPVLVMRRETERPEAVEAGTVALVGVERDAIKNAAQNLLDDGGAYRKMAKAVNPYGDGHASERIVQVLKRFLA